MKQTHTRPSTKRPSVAEIAEMVHRLVSSSERVLIAIDAHGLHVRKTYSVVQDLMSGDVTYVAEPIATFRGSKRGRAAVDSALQRLTPKRPGPFHVGNVRAS